MKTLDEVIKALEYCLNPVDNFGNCNAECPYIHCCDPSNHDVTEDALHYLKEYQRDKQIFSYDVAKRNLELSERNDPLSWEELKTLKGKPVWVEYGTFSDSGWAFISEISEKGSIEFLLPWGLRLMMHEGAIGKTWQAYRKERK